MPKGAPAGTPPKADKADKAARRDVTRRLRAALAERPLELGEMSAALHAEEELVLIALRRLGKRKRGRLRSGVVDGRNCWWWEPPPAAPPATPPAPEDAGGPP